MEPLASRCHFGQERLSENFHLPAAELEWEKRRRAAAAEEFLMKASNRCAKFLIAMAFFALGAAISTPSVAGQDEGWQLVRADYGFKNQRTDVTGLLRDLVSRGGVNGRIAVNNQTMGGDPAVGKDKSLRIFARNRGNQEREFDYNEGGFVDAHMFSVRNDDWGDHGLNDDRHDRSNDRDRYNGDGDRGRDDWQGLSILRGFYGVQGRTTNVTDLLRSQVRNGVLTMNVGNSVMGGDPAIGADKLLIVIYRYQGKEQAAAVREGNTLSIP
jgi:hypothetical protein